MEETFLKDFLEIIRNATELLEILVEIFWEYQEWSMRYSNNNIEVHKTITNFKALYIMIINI